MSIGLDLGTTEFRSLRVADHELIVRRCQTTYIALRDTVGHRRLLQHAQIRHASCGDNLIVFGNDAVECAGMLDTPAVPLLRHGRLPASDPVARQILALMTEAILPPAERYGDVCCMTVPGGYSSTADLQSIDVRFLQHLVSLRGYRTHLISPGMSIVLAELGAAAFSGLGISLGATSCDMSVIHCGRELARWSTEGGLSDLADEFPLDAIGEGSIPAAQQQAWDRTCLKVLTQILVEAREALVAEGSIRLIPQPVQIACAGGMIAAPGFASLFEQAWKQAGWPIKSGPVQLADQPQISISRGCLIQALMETRDLSEQAAA